MFLCSLRVIIVNKAKGVVCLDFEAVYKSYYLDVYRYVRSLSAAQDVAEEIAQETFLKAMKAAGTFDGRKDIRAWLFVIARNLYYNYCKRQKIYADQSLADTGDKKTFADVRFEPARTLIERERVAYIRQYLEEMDEPYRKVFRLRVFGELPFEKIGALFGKSPGWARVTYSRAKKRIALYMEGFEND